MGRHEVPLDPEGPLYEFAAGLRALRVTAGSPTYREMAHVAHVSPSALAAAASGRALPTWDVVAAYVRACGADPAGWRARWEERNAVLRTAAAAPPPVPGAPPTVGPLAHADPRRVGRLRTLGRLGDGALGPLYLAVGPAGRMAAVRVVRPEYAGDAGFRRRLAQELPAVCRVTGPRTPAVLDADARAGQPWIASAFVPGPSLAQVVAADGPLPEPVVWGLAGGVAEALAAIHRAGTVHGGLTASDILLDRDGPKVIDFGIARALGSSAGPGSPAGDVYALGAVLAYAAGESGSLRALIDACLAPDPSRRPTPERIMALARRDGAALPSAVVARATARAREAAGLLARARGPRHAHAGV